MHWNYEGIVKGIEAYNNGRQTHNRHLHVWRWEYCMYKYIGKNWTTLVQDRDTWNSKVQVAKYVATKGNKSL